MHLIHRSTILGKIRSNFAICTQLDTLHELLYKCVLLIKIKRKVVQLDEAMTQYNEVKCIIKTIIECSRDVRLQS